MNVKTLKCLKMPGQISHVLLPMLPYYPSTIVVVEFVSFNSDELIHLIEHTGLWWNSNTINKLNRLVQRYLQILINYVLSWWIKIVYSFANVLDRAEDNLILLPLHYFLLRLRPELSKFHPPFLLQIISLLNMTYFFSFDVLLYLGYEDG